ncbi:MAG: hypothetical protein U0797_22610 [Gemmataceae bacterium]
MCCLARGSDQAEAARLGDEVAGDPTASGAALYDAACVQAVAAAVTDAGRPLPLREKAAEGTPPGPSNCFARPRHAATSATPKPSPTWARTTT